MYHLFWCESIFGLYALKAIQKQKGLSSRSMMIVTAPELVGVAEQSFVASTTVSFRSFLRSWERILHGVVATLLMPSDFSSMYDRIAVRKSKIRRAFEKHLRIGFTPRTRNAVYRAAFLYRELRPKRFLSVTAFTRTNYPYLLVGLRPRPTLFIESWDHAWKSPFFLNLPAVTWNRELANRTETIQGLSRIETSFPPKFDYIHRLSAVPDGALRKQLIEKHNDLISTLKKVGDFVLYPMTTSEKNRPGFAEECKFVSELSTAIHGHDLNLVVKPKPNSQTKAFEAFKVNSIALVLDEGNSVTGAIMLSNSYDAYRTLLFRMAKLVVNIGTTFAIEAALSRVPVAQLLIDSPTFPLLTAYMHNPHIASFFVNSDAYFYGGKIQQLAAAANDEHGLAKNWTRRVAGWIHEA